MKNTLCIKRLGSGGLITNYYCTSRCGHCLYGCSPGRDKQYIDKPTARKNMESILALGCGSIHVGGGEPFLNPEGLRQVLQTAAETGMHVEYVETNSSWFRDLPSAVELLQTLKAAGLSTLLISISPFHNAHIPFFKVKGTIEACRSASISVFPWIADFYNEIDNFDDRTTHSLEEYQTRYGARYLARIPSRYWIHLGGRALKTFEAVYEKKSVEHILELKSKGCRELLDVSHFHMDLFGNYIPGLCAGLSMARQALGKPLPADTYPLLNALIDSGVQGLLKIAERDYGFKPQAAYISKCHLCFHIRKFLILECGIKSPELQPRDFYHNVYN
jgi:hypothetical protein